MTKARDLADFGSNPDEQTSIITVTVAAVGGSNKFIIDGTSQQTITMAASGVYKFDQSDSSNANHPLKISLTSNGTHGGGSAITTDFVVVGTAGQAGAYVTYTIQQDGADNYFYYCANHSGMGGSIRKSGNPTAAEILTSIKTVDGTGSGLDADTLDGVEAAALLPLSGGTMTGNLALGDNVKATFGAGDLEIFHDGLNSYVSDTGTGDIIVKGDFVRLQDSGGTNLLTADGNDAVSLFYAGGSRLSTTATGIDVTGTVQADQYNNDEALPDVRPSLLLDFANSKTLDPRITFTRGSTATFYDGKTTAKAEENLFRHSQEFNNGAWGKSDSAVSANSIAAPDGTTTADTVTADGGSAIGHSVSVIGGTATISSAAATVSVYAKKGSQSVLQILFYGPASNIFQNYNLDNGSLGSGGGSSSEQTSQSITDVGNGWYRCTVSGNFSSNNASTTVFSIKSSATSARAATETNSGTIYLWGAQLEQRSSATAYTPTTSSPIVKYQPALQTAASGAARFDHSPTTGESKGLLIEEARTNLIPYSADFSNSAWVKVRAAVYSNQVIAPDGTQTADNVVGTTVSGEHYIQDDLTAATGTFTDSVFVKANGVTSFIIDPVHVGADEGATQTATFNLSNGTIGSLPSNTTATITDVGNDWYRCTLTFTITGTLSGSYGVRLRLSVTGDGYKGVHLWGAQREAGSFATSYIPTSGSTVTRPLENAEITDISFLNPTELTVYFESEQAPNHEYRRWFAFGNNTNGTMEYSIWSDPNGYINSYVRINGVNQSSVSTQIAEGTDVKIAYSIAEGKVAMSVNGAAAGTGTSVNLAGVNLTRLRIGRGEENGSNRFAGKPIKKLAVYPKALSDATLKAMTTE